MPMCCAIDCRSFGRAASHVYNLTILGTHKDDSDPEIWKKEVFVKIGTPLQPLLDEWVPEVLHKFIPSISPLKRVGGGFVKSRVSMALDTNTLLLPSDMVRALPSDLSCLGEFIEKWGLRSFSQMLNGNRIYWMFWAHQADWINMNLENYSEGGHQWEFYVNRASRPGASAVAIRLQPPHRMSPDRSCYKIRVITVGEDPDRPHRWVSKELLYSSLNLGLLLDSWAADILAGLVPNSSKYEGIRADEFLSDGFLHFGSVKKEEEYGEEESSRMVTVVSSAQKPDSKGQLVSFNCLKSEASEDL